MKNKINLPIESSGGIISPRGRYNSGFSTKTNGFGGGTETGAYWRYGKNMADFSEFPAISYFMQKWKVYPSILKFDAAYVYEDFLAKIKSLNKVFYCDTSHVTYLDVYDNDDTEDFCIKFMCFEEKKTGIVFYITSSTLKHEYGISKILEKNKAKHYTITCLFTPGVNSHDLLKKIQDKIISLPAIEYKKEKIGSLNILTKTKDGYALKNNTIHPPDIDFDINYNSDFKPIHDFIVKKLSVDNSKGLVLLHGEPGTGKTTYIRYLINILKKKIIFIPPNLVNHLSDPELISFFTEKNNSILVIEDAENVLTTRSSSTTQSVSNILNLTDGLISDCANIQIVATFNSNILNIDKALLRKGRLIAKYEFKELENDRAKKLAQKLGVEINGNHILADIYNQEEPSFTSQKQKIGF